MNRAFSTIKRLLACAFAVALVLCVCACSSGPKAEEVVRSTVDNTFAIFKNPSQEDITQYVDEDTASQLTQYGIDLEEFLSYAFKHLDYTINDVTVDGDKATVALTVKNVNLDTAMDDALEAFDAWTNTDEAIDVYSSEGEDGLYKKLFELLYTSIDELAASGNIVSTDTTLYLETQEDGSWDVTESGNEDFYSSLYGGASFDL